MISDKPYRHLRRNFTLGVLNGLFFMAGSSLISPPLILPQFLSTVFESKAVIGIGSMLGMIGWCLPQVFVAYFLRAAPSKRKIYIVANWARMSFMGLFILFLWKFATRQSTIGTSYFVFFSLSGLCAGAAGLSYQDIVARTIPAHRRGSFNALRAFFGQGIMALATGLFARWVLEREDIFPYPRNYLMIFLVAWIMMVIGVACFSMVKEPRERNMRRGGGLGRYIAELSWIVKRNKNFRRFLLTRVMRSLELLALPFYIVFARERLGLADTAAASFFIVTVLATIPASLAWGRLSDKLGNRLVIIFSTLASLGAPLFALGLVVAVRFGVFDAAEISLGGVSFRTSAVIMWVIAPVFVLIKAAGVGGFIGFSNYVMDIAPDRRRPLYLGLQTSLQGVLIIIVPTLGGAIIDLTRLVLGREAYWVVFAITAIALTGSLMSARKLEEPRVHHARDILRPMPRQA